MDNKCNLYDTNYAKHTVNNLFIKMGNLYKVLKSLLKIENKIRPISLHKDLCGHEVNVPYKNPK